MKNFQNPSVMKHSFSQVPTAQLERSTFDRSHGYKTTIKDAGLLIPIFLDEALPGDTFSLAMTGFARLATPIYPIMDNMFMDTHFFACPIRLLWDNFTKQQGEQDNPGDSTDFTTPIITAPAGGYAELSLEDYMGLPTKVAGFTHSALFHRMYAKTYNEWYKDQNIINNLVWSKGNGPDAPGAITLQRRAKRPDYFTTCLPWPQKGPGVTIPLGTTAPVKSPANMPAGSGQWLTQNTGANTQVTASGIGGSGFYADLSQAASATINSLRQAFQIQRQLERDARGGTRYIEHLKASWKVTSPDFRLQRVEYLGGGSSPINITQVPQTQSTASGTTPQGHLAAYGTALLSNHGFTMSFTEHCLVMGLLSIRADLTYQQGLNRMWSRRTRWDSYMPALAHIGEQAVLSKEIFCNGAAQDDDVFGYQERAAEYRYKPSQITGQFRSNAATPLDAWHLSQLFAARPTLSKAFIEETPPIGRVIAVPSEPPFILDTYFKFHCARPMPVYSVPGMIDHF